MHTADANARNYSTFSRASAPDADADVALAIRLHEAGCERAAAAVLSGAAYDADSGADRRERRALRKWRRKCAAWRAQAEERIEREEEAASSRKLDPITPIELCEDGPAAGDLTDREIDDEDVALDILVRQVERARERAAAAEPPRQIVRRGPGVARRRLQAEDRRLLAEALGRPVAAA